MPKRKTRKTTVEEEVEFKLTLGGKCVVLEPISEVDVFSKLENKDVAVTWQNTKSKKYYFAFVFQGLARILFVTYKKRTGLSNQQLITVTEPARFYGKDTRKIERSIKGLEMSPYNCSKSNLVYISYVNKKFGEEDMKIELRASDPTEKTPIIIE